MSTVLRALMISLVVIGASVPSLAMLPAPFEQAVRDATVVVLGRYVDSAPEGPQLEIVKVLKGDPEGTVLQIREVERFDFSPETGNAYLVALGPNYEPYDSGIACGTRNILGVAGRHLYTLEDFLSPHTENWVKVAFFEFNEDETRMTLDQLRARISRLLSKRSTETW